MIQRAYSIVSSPGEEELEFFFELVPQGELTPLLFQLQAEDSIWMRRQAKGRFTLDETSGRRKHFVLSTVTGVAPYMSMVRTFAHAASEGRPPGFEMAIIQAASRSWEFAYREELEKYAHAYPVVSANPNMLGAALSRHSGTVRLLRISL